MPSTTQQRHLESFCPFPKLESFFMTFSIATNSVWMGVSGSGLTFALTSLICFFSSVEATSDGQVDTLTASAIEIYLSLVIGLFFFNVIMNCITLLETRDLSIWWKNMYLFLSTFIEYWLCAKCFMCIISFSIYRINNFTI